MRAAIIFFALMAVFGMAFAAPSPNPAAHPSPNPAANPIYGYYGYPYNYGYYPYSSYNLYYPGYGSSIW